MTVKEFTERSDLRVVCMPSPDKEVSGAYVGDLLSWVMGRAEPSNVWITIMSNINIVAVATLSDVSCILLCEDVCPDGDALAAAKEKGVNILATSRAAFDAAVKVSELLS